MRDLLRPFVSTGRVAIFMRYTVIHATYFARIARGGATRWWIWRVSAFLCLSSRWSGICLFVCYARAISSARASVYLMCDNSWTDVGNSENRPGRYWYAVGVCVAHTPVTHTRVRARINTSLRMQVYPTFLSSVTSTSTSPPLSASSLSVSYFVHTRVYMDPHRRAARGIGSSQTDRLVKHEKENKSERPATEKNREFCWHLINELRHACPRTKHKCINDASGKQSSTRWRAALLLHFSLVFITSRDYCAADLCYANLTATCLSATNLPSGTVKIGSRVVCCSSPVCILVASFVMRLSSRIPCRI